MEGNIDGWNGSGKGINDHLNHLPGTLDESGIGHRDVGANQWHPDAALGNAEVLQNWCRSVPEDGSTSSWRVKQNWVRKAKYWNRSNTAVLLL